MRATAALTGLISWCFPVLLKHIKLWKWQNSSQNVQNQNSQFENFYISQVFTLILTFFTGNFRMKVKNRTTNTTIIVLLSN